MSIRDKILSPILLDKVFIFGFRLYPRAVFKIHKTFTAFFGRNGSGKTTILDAVQIALIANQKYIRLNPTAQRGEERTLEDYLGSDVGYIVLALKGHERIKNMGIRLEKRLDGRVLFKYFVAENVPLEQEDFIEGNILRNDLTEIAKSLRMRGDGTGNIRSFDNAKDYHRALFQQGILPFDLSNPKVLREFSTIFTAASTGLTEKTKILKDILCPAKKGTANFLQQLEKIFKQRQDIKRKIQDIHKAREEISNLYKHLEETEKTGLQFFGSQLFKVRRELKRIEAELREWKQREQEASSAYDKLTKQLQKLEQEKEIAQEEREKLFMNLQEQQRLVRAKKRFQTLNSQIAQLEAREKEINKKLSCILKELEKISKELEKYSEKADNLQKFIYKLQRDVEEKQNLMDQAKKFNQARKKLEAELGRKFEIFENLYRKAENLSALKRLFREKDTLLQLLAEKKARYTKQKKAASLARELKMMGIENFDLSYLEALKEELNAQEQKILLQRQNLKEHIQKAKETLYNLENYQAELPDAFKNSKGRYLFEQYEEISWEQAAYLEMILGPLTCARIIQNKDEALHLCQGNQRLYFILEGEKLDLTHDVIECSDGVLIIKGKVLRYEPRPKAPILGKKARLKRIESLKQEIFKLMENDKNLTGEMTTIEDKRKKIEKLLPLLDYLKEKNLETEISKLQNRVSHLENNIQIATRLKKELLIIKQSSPIHSDYKQLEKEYNASFRELNNVKDQYNECKDKIEQLKKNINALNDEKQEIEKTKTEIITNISELKGQIKTLMEEYPLKVLQQEIGVKEKELQDELSRAKQKVEELEKEIREIDKKINKNEYQIKIAQENYDRLAKDREKWVNTEKSLREELTLYFEDNEPPLCDSGVSRSDFQSKLVLLEREMDDFASEHGEKIPPQKVLKKWVEELISLVYPEYTNFAILEEKLSHLRTELKKIEHSIRQVVGNFKNDVYEQVARIERKVRRINKRMEDLRFGRVRQVKLQVLKREAYHKLNNLAASNSLLNYIQNKHTSFEEFIRSMARELGYLRTDPTYEEIVDYRYYIDLDFTVIDIHNKERRTGLSNGESLGVNLAIITALLENMAQDDTTERFKTGLAFLTLDEADRLDHTAIETVYSLMEQSGIQLLTALPNIPLFNHGFLYQLLPTPQGVVWVSSAVN